jgi:formate hydrogenlyase subunit 3/multisubunit Na+/H+ antiporter MnhD subunit
MSYSSKQLNKGFVSLVSLIVLASSVFVLVYITLFRMSHLQFSQARYEDFVMSQYKIQSCQNFVLLFSSFDIHYQVSDEVYVDELIIC